MVQEGWKKHTTGDANGDKNSENKKNIFNQKEGKRNKKNMCSKKKNKRKKIKENKMK